MATPLEKRALEVSQIDPFKLAEEITGVDDMNANSGVAFWLLHARERTARMMYSELGDTHFRIAWDEFEKIAENFGFETLEVKRVRYAPSYDKDNVMYPKKVVSAHREKKLLLVANSYVRYDGAETVNHVNVYGTLKSLSRDSDIWEKLDGLSLELNAAKPEDEWEFKIDARVGMVTTLNSIEERGFQFVDWHDLYEDGGRLIYLNTYEEQDSNRHDVWASINSSMEKKRRLLETSPQWVRDFVQGK